ncbi:AAA family ATPase [Egicoccus sp. AB-alg2]|uniref:AAA family ATPase n=1 Tax=Egicoccus sp. AB-alg2 TaxID=3242693 RepID=UPI00359D94CC
MTDDARREHTATIDAGGRQRSDSVAAALGGAFLGASAADVGTARERRRQARLRTLAVVLAVPLAFLWYRILDGRPFQVFALPGLPDDPILYVIPLVFVVALLAIVAMPLASGRSPHLTFRPEQIDVSLADVKGIDAIVEEVVRTLNTFLGYARFREQLGGTPRRGLLFEGPPGTGKTHLAKALAREAGVPFLFVSATSFQSMWYGATARKIRAYFRALRKAARREGGAIGFIEEIDAIATARGGMNATPAPTLMAPCGQPTDPAPAHAHEQHLLEGTGLRLQRMMSEGTGGIVNELLIQMQSFDQPPWHERARNAVSDWINGFLPLHRQIQRKPSAYNNLLLIAATNRADRLDPAMLRPGRFDRRLTFEPPARAARRDLIDHFLARKSHAAALDDPELRDALAGQTFGYTPVMIEHLLDEALLHALRDGRDALDWRDVQGARLNEEVGLKNPVVYTDHERRVVATHEAGHATVAFLTQRRKLEVLSIVKRSGSLGLLAHGDLDEVYTRAKSELQALVDIAMGGMVAEELYFGESSTGPSGDLVAATRVACEAVGAAGMGGSLVSLAAVQNGPLGDTNLVGRTLADPVTRPEVDRLLAVSKARVRALIDANRHILEALRDALLDRDELVGDEITAVAEAAGPPVTEGLRVERRGQDRRRTDHLEGAEVATPWATPEEEPSARG